MPLPRKRRAATSPARIRARISAVKARRSRAARPAAPSPATRGRRFVYGPVPSRRLGFSLGVDIIPYKTCTLDCVYCQLGTVRHTTCRRRAWFSVPEVLAQIRAVVASARRVDYITFSGSGEPTLNTNLGPLIRAIKKATRIPVAVLTNGTLLTRRGVRADLDAADLVVPSLDAADSAMFSAVNRPHLSLDAKRVIDGLVRFRKEFRGQLWLEIMLVRGLNDSPAHLRALKAAAESIAPDRIQLNTVVRPPAERSARPLTPRELERARRVFGPKAEVVASFTRRQPAASGAAPDLDAAVASVIKRRPVTASDLAASLGKPRHDIVAALCRLAASGQARALRHGRRTFYEPA